MVQTGGSTRRRWAGGRVSRTALPAPFNDTPGRPFALDHFDNPRIDRYFNCDGLGGWEKRMKSGLIFAVLICGVFTLQVSADTNLYGPELPEDIALIRVINVAADLNPSTVNIGALSFIDVGFTEATPYRPIVPDIYIAASGKARGEIIIQPGYYYSVVVSDEGITAWKDITHTDPARAQLYLYNFSSIPEISLETSETQLSVINRVQTMSSGVVVVNPVPVRFRVVWHDGAKGNEVPPFILERGESFSIVVSGPESQPNFTVWRAKVEMN